MTKATVVRASSLTSYRDCPRRAVQEMTGATLPPANLNLPMPTGAAIPPDIGGFISPMFQAEAESIARIIALAYEPTRQLTDPPRADVARLIAEALQSAYEARASPAKN